MGCAWVQSQSACPLTDCLTHFFFLYCVGNVVLISFVFRHKAFTVLDPHIIGTPSLHLMNCYKVAVSDITSPIKPASPVFLPILWKINPRLWACRAEERHLRRLRLRRSIPKSKPLSFLHIPPLAAHSQQFTVSILNGITDLQMKLKRFNQLTHWNALRNGLICHSSKFLKIVICRRLTFQIFQQIVVQQLKCEDCSDLFICRGIIPHLEQLNVF
jgi:hypothetical protein